MNPLRLRLEELRDQARRDLAELDAQVQEGEIDEGTAEALRQTYREELADAARRLSELGEDAPEEEAPQGRSRRRVMIGGAILVAAFAGSVALAGRFVQTRNEALQGAAAPSAGSFDPSKYSNETLEAVVAANAENPNIDGMRFALANRYFQAGEYQKAFPHYQKILDDNPSPELAAAVLARLGWMVYQGNGDADTATTLLDRSLSLVPDDPLTLIFKARVRWCGAGDPGAAVPLLQKVLQVQDLDSSVRSEVESELAAAQAGGSCP